MPSHVEVYKNRTITINDAPHGAHHASAHKMAAPGQELRIDDTVVPMEEIEPNAFVTDYLPYMSYPSVAELGKAVIDHVMELPGKQR